MFSAIRYICDLCTIQLLIESALHVYIHIYTYVHIDFSIVKARYVEMIACLPENYEATIGTLQNQLSNSDICEILTLTSGHNQKILNCLILKLRSKEDLFDFCESLEKINGAHALLQQITEQIRKGRPTVRLIYLYIFFTLLCSN